MDRLYALVGGHPYLVRRCLQELRLRGLDLPEIEAGVERGDSLFNDHLGRMRLALQRDPEMEAALRSYLNGRGVPHFDLFMRLRAAGVMRGDTPQDLRPRCRLYERYLHQVFA